jgi:hypothetical protein
VREAFEEHTFRGKSLSVIETANSIIEQYQRQGFTLTLRQLYYQFVSRDLIPNQQSEYKKLGATLNKGRLAGVIDWSAIEDRTRNMQHTSTWVSPESSMYAVARQYKEDAWATQPNYVVVLVEKDALLGVIEPVCTEQRVPYMSCRGHISQSEMYSLGKRLGQAVQEGQKPLILHLGDHDPSGVHMTEDIRRRLSMFAEEYIQVDRLALNMDQIRRYRPPPNPAKESDSRHAAYVRDYGTDNSWELDALDPTVIATLIRDAVDAARDSELWEQALAKERSARETLQGVESNFADVGRYLRHRSDFIALDGFEGELSADDILDQVDV